MVVFSDVSKIELNSNARKAPLGVGKQSLLYNKD